MTIKKMVSAICLAAGLAISIPALTAVTGLPSQMGVVKAADGWTNDGKSYVRNNAKLTGLQTIDGATYYFDKNGNKVTGSIKLDKYTYYFHPDTGKLCTGYAGLVRIGKNSNTYYFFLNSKKGRVAVKKWVKYNGKYYYAGTDGKIQLGTVKIGGKLYHLTPKGRMTSFGKSSYDGKYYNAQKNGVLLTGLRKVNGKQYYFDKKTGASVSGTVKVGKSTFYFSEDGTAKTGWVKIDGKYYYYLKNYKKATGLRTINGKKYYLNAKQGGARTTSQWLKVGKNTYYFGSDGAAKTGLFKLSSKLYYTNSSGVRQTGWKTVSGRKYFFMLKTGAAKTGWYKSGKKTYYLTPSVNSKTYGAAITGWLKLNGKNYFFDDDGSMHTGWLQVATSSKTAVRYYFDKSTGEMYTGTHYIDGQTTNFGSNGKIQVELTGSWTIRVQRGNSKNGNKCYVVAYRGGTAVKAFVCSTARDGKSTPTGTFRIWDKLYWHELMGPSWGQYCSHITSSILFHSVPNLRANDPYSLETWEYNKLGSPASAGCIRLSVKHAKWLFENVPTGSTVIVSDNVSVPSYITIETVPKQDSSKSYDPTDTFKNPYNKR